MNKSSQKNLKVVLVILVILLVGVVAYFFIINNSPSTSQAPRSEESNTADVGAMMAKVKMEMPKTEVDQMIGKPYECTQAQPATAEDAQHNMERCSYGDKNATNHLSVTYMDAKVWGTTSVSNTAQ